MERAMEWLRPLVDSNNWDYCVVWKLGDDPSRFIEWIGCCCSGAKGVDVNVKKENGGQLTFTTLCRDSQIQHPITTKACEALAHFPLSICLYSGIQGEVVTSNEPKWINHTDVSNSNLSNELKGTLVLIPVAGGLVELYNSKLIHKDQKTIDFIINRFKLGSEKANSSTAKREDPPLDSFPFEKLSFCAPPLYTSSPSSATFISQVSESSANPSIQGSPTGSIPSNEPTLCHSTSDHLSRSIPLSQSSDVYFEHTELQCSGNLSRMEGTVFPRNQENCMIAGDVYPMGKKRQRGPYQSKNLVTERKLRNRIKDGLFALRALVPNISKMDKVAILGDAIDYINELQENVKLYQAELNEIAAEVSNNGSSEVVLSDMSEMSKVTGPTNEKTQIPINTTKRTRMEVEVNQIGAREFLLKVFGSRKPGGFTQLLEAMNSLGLEVVNTNFTTSGEEILSIFIARANDDRVFEAQQLRSSLIELTS